MLCHAGQTLALLDKPFCARQTGIVFTGPPRCFVRMLGRLWCRMGALVSWVPAQALESEHGALRNGKLGARQQSAELGAPDTPHLKEKRRSSCFLLDLPQELLDHISTLHMEATDMCAIAQTCTRLRALSEGSQTHWRGLFAERFGDVTDLQVAAAKLAGGWNRLYAARHVVEKESQPWQKPSSFEVEAAVMRLASMPAAGASSNSELCIVFLVDGSGSVTEDDFTCMTEFMQTAVNSIAAMGCPSKVSVLQFSNDVRVEMSPQAVDVESFGQLMQNMHRMNGGTNISMAVQKAGQLLKPLGDEARRVVVLLTDGRVDSHQAREAHDMAGRLADEQPNVDMYAFGVGRGVDKQELVHIISAREPESAEGRYMGLCILDEAPW